MSVTRQNVAKFYWHLLTLPTISCWTECVQLLICKSNMHFHLLACALIKTRLRPQKAILQCGGIFHCKGHLVVYRVGAHGVDRQIHFQNVTNKPSFSIVFFFLFTPFHWGIKYWRQLPTKVMMPKKRGGKIKTLLKKCCYCKTQVLFKDKEKRGRWRSESMEPVAKRGVTILLLNSFGKRWQEASERNKQSTHFVSAT